MSGVGPWVYLAPLSLERETTVEQRDYWLFPENYRLLVIAFTDEILLLTL